MVDGFAVELGKFLEQLALARRQAARRLDDYLDQLVAFSVAVKIDDALALEAQNFTRLRGGRNLQLHLALERRHFYFGADRRLRETDRRFDYHVVVLAHEHLVLLDVDDDVEIALRTAAVAGLALAAQFEARSIVDARRNFHGERFVLADSPLSLALGARVGNDHAFAAALPAGRRDRKKSLLRAHLAAAAAIGALACAAGAAARARAVAGLALGEALELYDSLDSARRFFEFDFQIVAQVVAAPRARARTSAAGAEEIAEDVGENFLEALAEVEAPESARTALRSLEGRVTEAIVLRATLGIGQNLVGLVEFLESLLGFLVAGIAIGMTLNGERAVRLLQLYLAGATVDAENFVVISLIGWRHRGDSMPSSLATPLAC